MKKRPNAAVQPKENKVLIDPHCDEQAHLHGYNIKTVKELSEALLALHTCATSGADEGKARIQGERMDYVIEWNNRIHYYDIHIVRVDTI